MLDDRALTGTQIPGSHREHAGAETAADLSPGQVGLGQDSMPMMTQDLHPAATPQKNTFQRLCSPLPYIPLLRTPWLVS